MILSYCERRKTMEAHKHIIWDWNGTLIDDVDIVIDAMNVLLKKRKLTLLDYKTYKDIFTFPVQDYYAHLGFDFGIEAFEQLATEYIAELNSDKYCFKLYTGVKEILDVIQMKGITQSILSASQEEELKGIVKGLGISGYFNKIAGLDNHYAKSKVEKGKTILDELELKPQEVLLVGDTIHDYEVSQEIGCDCLLVACGHQSYERLASLEVDIVNSLSDVMMYIQGATIHSAF